MFQLKWLCGNGVGKSTDLVQSATLHLGYFCEPLDLCSNFLNPPERVPHLDVLLLPRFG